jgi:RNA polymerase sigma-70 factor, ECF subfamily
MVLREDMNDFPVSVLSLRVAPRHGRGHSGEDGYAPTSLGLLRSDSRKRWGVALPNETACLSYMRLSGPDDHDASRLTVRGDEIQELETAPASRSQAGLQTGDRELLVRVQGGDSEAFDLLVRRYLPRARVVARRVMRDPDDADDLVQDAFLRALEKISTFDVTRAFEPWFTRLLVNLGLDLRRKQIVRRTEAHDPDTFGGGTRPDRETERAELRASLGRALEKLPDRQRLIVSLFEIDGLSTEEVAGMLEVSQVTVRWHLHQARKALRDVLKEWAE